MWVVLELKYSLKQPMVYIFLGLMTLFTFGATVSDNIQIGGSVGNVYKNAPYIITIYTTIMTLFGLLIAVPSSPTEYNFNSESAGNLTKPLPKLNMLKTTQHKGLLLLLKT